MHRISEVDALLGNLLRFRFWLQLLFMKTLSVSEPDSTLQVSREKENCNKDRKSKKTYSPYGITHTYQIQEQSEVPFRSYRVPRLPHAHKRNDYNTFFTSSVRNVKTVYKQIALSPFLESGYKSPWNTTVLSKMIGNSISKSPSQLKRKT